MDTKLSEQEWGIVMEALDAWIDKDAAGEMMCDVLMMAVSERGPEAQDKMRQEQESRRIESKKKKQLRKEQIIMLKAKVLSLQQSAVCDRL